MSNGLTFEIVTKIPRNTLIELLQMFFIVHSTIDSTAHMPLNSLEHCICTTPDDKYSNWPGFDPSSSEFRVTTGLSEPSGWAFDDASKYNSASLKTTLILVLLVF